MHADRRPPRTPPPAGTASRPAVAVSGPSAGLPVAPHAGGDVRRGVGASRGAGGDGGGADAAARARHAHRILAVGSLTAPGGVHGRALAAGARFVEQLASLADA